MKVSLEEYLLFYKSVYKNDLKFKDNKTGIIKIICCKNRAFYKRSKQEIIGVKDNEKLLCACALIIHDDEPQMLCVAFFEALQNCQKAVDILIAYAMKFGRQNGTRNMMVGLDGHVNNSFSFPVGNGLLTFGENYCPQYYHTYFDGFDKIKSTSFYDNADLVKSRIQKDLPRIKNSKAEITIDYADFGSGFADTIRRYTNLNNEIFVDHKYYFHRNYDEDYDLFCEMRPLLKKENLIFATCDGKDIGFILWYPDYNELVPVGKGACILTFIKYKIFHKSPKTAKVMEIGVSAKYRRFGTILLLFDAAMKATAKNTNKIISSWILDENIKSKSITQRYSKKQYKDYVAYEKEI